MDAYAPSGPAVVAALALALIAVLLAGFAFARRAPASAGSPTRGAARALAWAMLALGIAGVERLCADEAPGFRMLALIAIALLALKAIVVVEERARGLPPMPFARWLGFAAGWLGMQPRLFSGDRAPRREGARALLVRGAVWLAVGIALVLLARLAWTSTRSRLLATACLLPGLSLALHFGLLNLLAGAWRLRGVPCDALFRAPLRSESLAEFWARRWNLAFSEMTAIAVYRPLSARVGRGPALFASFLVSGALHEMAISLPVRAGFGLPLLYFALHGSLVLTERALARADRPVRGLPGRVWTLVWLALPLPLLFHRPFLAGVVWPLIGIEPDL